MSLLALVLLVVMGLLYLSSMRSFDDLVTRTLHRTIVTQETTGGRIGPTQRYENEMPQVPVVLISGRVTEDGIVMDRILNADDIEEELLLSSVTYVLESGEAEGTGWGNRIRWMSRVRNDEYTIAAAGMMGINEALKDQLVTSAITFAISMVALTGATWYLSGWAFAPVEKAMAQQRQFIADASHELKTPLSVIIANLQILEHGPLGQDDESRMWIERTDEEAHHMQDLITDMLELAKTEADENPVDRSGAVDASSQVEKVALQLDALAYERGVTIETQVEEGIMVQGNPNELERLAMTLIDNACKYADKGSTVYIRLTRHSDEGRLSVNNRGTVIDEEDLPHVFERFYRSDRSRTQTPQSGYGLGLAIAKGIAESHGGSIRVTSTEREGTTFVVTIPIARPPYNGAHDDAS